ncbi:MAG: phenylacetate--CoA ligase family protein, partial [Chloroflexi bacterium]|nr:phenylacetate--CoA ligase family protein [Chloroflexota bacterium]
MNRTIWNADVETMSEAEQAAMEREKLARQLDYVYSESPFYRSKLTEAGLSPRDVRGPEDLSGLPFTTKAELRESQEREPPFGDYLAASRESVTTVHRSSGSTGKFIYAVLTDRDMEQTNECGARAFWAAGLRPHHTVVHCLNYSLWMGGFTDHRNLARTGAGVIPFGVGNSRQLVRTIQEVGVDAISCTPSYPSRLADVVRDEMDIEPPELGLKLGLFGGEPGLEDPGFRARMEETWGFKARNANYGMAEVLCNFASVCDEAEELHFLGQGAVLPELIDPSSGDVLPIEPGASGELVLTNLDREAQPLVRYRTRDLIGVLGTGPCPCGRTGFRFRVAGRSDDMLHVRGINVFPSGIAEVLNTLTPDVNGEFQVVLSGPGPYDSLDILVESEHGADSLRVRI